MEAHEQLEELILDRETLETKKKLGSQLAQVVYEGKWFTPLREAIQAFVESTQKYVTGEVKFKIYKGNIIKEKAILKSDLGLNPTNDGKIIRLVVPELNEERRKELTKLVRKGAEESKVAIRSIRRDAMEQFKKLEKDGLITEDDRAKAEKKMQEATDAAIKGIDELSAKKEKEIMEV